MPLLTLTWVDGRPHLEVDGITVKNVSLVSVEIEANQQPVIQIEMSPDDAVTVLGHGYATWIVTCPSCKKDTHHTCDLAQGREIKPFNVNEDASVELHREISKEMPLLDIDSGGNVVTVPQARIVDPSELGHDDDFPI